MSYKIVLFAVAVFGSQVNAQVGGFLRPFATGFANGFNEAAKPFVQFGQNMMAPISEFGQRVPYVPQMMNYPSKIVPQAQAAAYEGFQTVGSAFPHYIQGGRPGPKPQGQFFQIPNQAPYMRPPMRPLPANIEGSFEAYRPSNLLIKPEVPEIEAAQPEIPEVEIPQAEIPQIEVPEADVSLSADAKVSE